MEGVKPLRVPVYYDFASSVCYVAHRVMERMAEDLAGLQIELVWKPVDLTRFSAWDRGARFGGARRENALRVARELRVPLRLHDRWIDSRPAMAVALALGGTARETAWRERVWSAIYDEARTLEEPGQLEALARDLRIDLDTLELERRLEALELYTEECVEAEVSGVPTFILDGWPIGGIQSDDTMRSLLGRFAARQRQT